MMNTNLATLIDAAGLTQAEAANMCHVPLRTLQRWLSGQSRMPGAAWELLQIKTGYFVPERLTAKRKA